MSFRRRRLGAVVLGTAVVLLAAAPGSYADAADLESTPAVAASPAPAAAPDPTPAPTTGPTTGPTAGATTGPTTGPTTGATTDPTAAPDATPEPADIPAATPRPPDTPAAPPAGTPQPAAAPIAASEASVGDTGGTPVAAVVPQDLKSGFNPVVSRVTRADLPYTWRPGCPVAPSHLRLLQVTHLGFDGRMHRGEIVVASSAVGDVSAVFQRALDDRFPIRLMRRVDRYHGSDVRSMEKDNTSAFNCRHVTGNPTRLSQHSYGNAVDVNTRENPYVTGSRVYPSTSRTYLNRSNVRKGMLVRSGPIPKEFARLGWPWGARWSRPDYQHFSSNGK